MSGIAVCCGFNEYEDPELRTLTRASNDATSIYTRLTESGMFNAAPGLIGQGSVFTQRTQARVILAALTRAAESAAEVVWFSFSGHARVSAGGELRLLLPEWRRDGTDDEQRMYSVGADEIESVLRSRLASKRFVVVLDACHSGAFGSGAVTRDATRPIEARLASAGAVVISSCSRDQVAADGCSDSLELHGAFSSEVIKVLEHHVRTRTALRVLELFEAAKGGLTNGQIPTLYANGLTANFAILHKSGSANDGLVPLSAEVPAKIKNELEAFLSSVVQIHRCQRVGLVHAERQLESLAAEFYRYGDETFVVSGHNSNVIEAFDNARRCILGCTTPAYADEWRRAGSQLLASNRELVGRGGRVIRLFFVPDDFRNRFPGLLNIVRDQIRAGIVAIVVNVDSFGPSVLQEVFKHPRPDDLSQLECAFIDGKVFLRTHFTANGNLKIEVDQRSARCQNEYRTQLRPFLSPPGGALFGARLTGDSDDGVALHTLRPDEVSALKHQLEDQLALTRA